MKNLLVVFIVAAALIAPGTHMQSETAIPGTRRVEVEARRFAFDPAVITLKRGEPAVLVLKSDDVSHGVRFRELGVEVKVSKGGTGEIQFTPNKTGDFVGHCIVFCGAGHGTMSLTLHVVG